jgi:putative ABC transport system ATP-binding protein
LIAGKVAEVNRPIEPLTNLSRRWYLRCTYVGGSAGRVGHLERGKLMTGKHALEVENVVKSHISGTSVVLALRGMSLNLDAGELVAVMGPSGSGKSTLLNLAGGLDRATSGRVRVAGRDLAELSRSGLAALRRRRVGYVFQDYNLIPSLTAAENVALPLELEGVRSKAAAARAAVMLEAVGMPGLGDRFPANLSGGQQQRVAIARAVIGERALILADEPTGALDSETGEQILSLIRDKCAAGAAALLVTHDRNHARWADRVVTLRDGAVAEPGEPSNQRAGQPNQPRQPGQPGSGRLHMEVL